ncbi:MAG TPA: hypothetical protein VGO07_05165, partial [Candidatus Saccharimonadales bacterium]|nr:hypothetical protein [Candidatus Saccharimonadales bacterium]
MSQKVRIPLLRLSKPLLAVFAVALVLLSTFAVVLHKPGTALAATSNSINFQARLMSNTGGIVPDGFYNVEFKIYNAVTSGTLQFTDTYYDSNGVTAGQDARVRVANGYLTVSLGSQASNPFPSTIKWDQQMWITMNIGGTTQTATPTWDGEMSPRLQLTAVPYAFRAGQLASLAGSFTGVLQFAGSFGQDSTITLPDPAGPTATVCYQGSASCGFVTGTAAGFIQNGTTVQTAANFNIRSAAIGSVGAVVQGASGQTADLLDLQSWNGTTATTLFGVDKNGVLTVGGGQTADITSNGNLTIASGSTNASLTLNSNGTGTLNVGTTASSKTINIGTVGSTAGSTTIHMADSSDAGSTQTITIGSNANAASATNITAGTTGGINIGTIGSAAAGSSVHIADTSSTSNAQAVTIGSTAANTSNLTVIQGGSNTTQAIQLLPNTAGGIMIGASAGTGTITLGQSTAANTINIGSANFTAANLQTVNIANGSQTTAASTLAVNILSGAAGNAGTATLNLANNDRVTGVNIGNVAADAARTLNLFSGDNVVGVDTLNIGTGNSTVAAGKTIHIGDGAPSGSGTNVITVGSIASVGSTTTIQGGNGTGAVSVQAAGSGTISIGTNASNVITVGNTASTGTLTLGQSSSANTINIGSANFTAANLQTVNIANGTQTTAASTLAVNILSGGAGNSGTATLSLANNDRVTQVDIGNVVADASRTLNVFSGNTITGTTDTINIGTGNTVGTGAKVIHIGDGTPAGTNTVTVGSIASTANVTTVQGGNGAGAVSIQAAASGTINVGDTNNNQLTLGGATSVVKLGNLGASTATAIAVCRDSSTTNLIACTAGTGTGTPFLQGGNSFNATGVLGTSDNFGLQIKTNNIVRATFDNATNGLYLGLGITNAAPTAFAVQATGSSTAGTAGAALTIQGGAGASATTGSAGGAVTIQGGNAAGTGGNAGGNIILTPGTKTAAGAAGIVQIQPAAGNDSTSLFNIKNAGTNNVFTVDSVNARVGIGLGGSTVPTLTGQGIEISDGSLRFSNNGVTKDLYITPGTGATVKTVINVVNFDPGANSQILAFGLPSTTANANTRALSVFDARAGVHQPTISLFSVDENSVFGLSWDGSSSTARLKTDGTNATQASILIQPAASTAGTAGGSTLAGGDVNGATVTGGVASVQGGNATGSGTRTGGGVTIDGGTGASANGVINLGVTNSNSINIGSVGGTVKATTVSIASTTDATNAQAVTIGSTAANTGNLTVIQGGSNATQAIQLLPNALGGIMIGAATGTGTITLGQSTASNTISIGSATPVAAATQTINIGNGSQSNATSSIAVNILSGAAGTNGTGQLNLGNNDRVTGIDIGNVVADASRTLNVFSGNTLTGLTDTINIGTGNTVGTGTKVIHIGDGTPAGTNAVTVGSIASTGNVTTIQGGNGTGAVSIQAASSGTIIIGNTNSNAVTLGGTSGTTTLNGTIKVNTLGAATATAAAVCRDTATTNLVACDSTNTSGQAFLQGGNNFGASTPGVLGTQDNNNLQVITNNIARATFDTSNNLYLGNGVTAAAPSNFTVSGTGSSAATVTGGNLTVQGGVGNTTGGGGTVKIQGGGSGNGAAALGGDVTIQGGTANGTGVSNGGNVNIQGGTLAATGTKGLIQLNGSTYFTSGTFSSGASSATITQSLVDSNSSIMATATAAGSTFTLPSPTIQSIAGRVLYLTNNGATNAFILTFGTTSFSLNPGSTATLIWQWNGTTGSWTSAGVDASTLQNVYSNSTGSNTPEILLDSSPHKGLDIQDANTTIGANESLLSIRASATATSLGASLFVVNASGKVGINLGGTTNVTAPTISNDLSFGQIAGAATARTIGVDTQTGTNIGGNGLSLTAGTANGTGPGGQITLQGGGTGTGAAAVGGAVLIQGGTSSGASGASNGGAITLQGGTAGTGGVKGLIQLNGATYFTTGSYSSASTASITQSLIDSNSAILATATNPSLTFTVPTPTTSVSGRLLYITNSGTNSFILSFSGNTLTLNPGATATLIWNAAGSVWTGAGADSSSLQNGYNNSTGGGTPEILLDGVSHFGLDIQDSNSGLGSTVPLLAVRASASATTLGNPLFVVESNAGAPLVGIGTATASRALDIEVNNSTSNAPPLLIGQSGSGDSSIELKNSSENFFLGLDATDKKFKISSASAAGGGQIIMGNNSTPSDNPPGSDFNDSGNANVQFVHKRTMGGTPGIVSTIYFYVRGVHATPNNQAIVGIYANDAVNNRPSGTPVVQSSAQVLVPNSWNAFPVTATTLSAGATYWLAWTVNGANTVEPRTTPGAAGLDSKFLNTGSFSFPNGSSFAAGTGGTDNYYIYAPLTPSGSFDSFANTPLFTMSDIGEFNLRNIAGSTTAFQVQNAAGTNYLGLDTLNSALNLGIVGATATASTVNVGTSTGATQTVNIGSSTVNTAANGTTVLVQGGNTA